MSFWGLSFMIFLTLSDDADLKNYSDSYTAAYILATQIEF